MYTSVITLAIIYTLILLYIYIRYNLDAKDSAEYEIYREKLEVLPSEAAYLLNKNCDSLNIILADILTLIEKGYITMSTIGEGKQRDYIFTKVEDAENTNIKNHEMSSYRLFFRDRERVSLKEYLESLQKNTEYLEELELRIPSIKNDIEMELSKQGIIDEVSERRLFKFNKLSITLILIFGISFFTTMFLGNIEYFEFSCVGLLFSIIMYRTTGIREDKLTKHGAQIKKQAEGFRRFIQEYIISEDKPLYMVNVLEYNYTMAIAFGFAELGENEFIHKTYEKIKSDKAFEKFIYFIIIVVIALISLL